MSNENMGELGAASKRTAIGDGAELELQRKMLEVRESHPQWYAEYEDNDPYTADRQTLAHLLSTAPTDFAAGVIAGITTIRMQISFITDRPF